MSLLPAKLTGGPMPSLPLIPSTAVEALDGRMSGPTCPYQGFVGRADALPNGSSSSRQWRWSCSCCPWVTDGRAKALLINLQEARRLPVGTCHVEATGNGRRKRHRKKIDRTKQSSPKQKKEKTINEKQ